MMIMIMEADLCPFFTKLLGLSKSPVWGSSEKFKVLHFPKSGLKE